MKGGNPCDSQLFSTVALHRVAHVCHPIYPPVPLGRIITGEKPMRNIINYLKQLASQSFYGELVIKFKDGKPVMVRATAQYLPDSLPVRSD